MTTLIETTQSPEIQIESVAGKLRMRGRPGTTVEIRTLEEDKLTVREFGDPVERLTIKCESECLVFAPPESDLRIGSVGGEASVRDVERPIELKTVGGDLRLRLVGEVSLGTVGGDLSASKIGGPFSAGRVGGDVLVDQVQGAVVVRNIGGDARFNAVDGPIEATAGGDVHVFTRHPGALTAGGDIAAFVPDDASLRIEVIAGGECRLAVPVESESLAGGCAVTLGEGESTLTLSAGANVVLRTGDAAEETSPVDLGEAIAARVGAEIEAHMIDIEDRLSGLGDQLQTFDSEQIGNRIRTSILKAQRRAAASQRVRVRSARGGPVTAIGHNEDELRVLKMLEQGKISVTEAEALLDALGY